MKSLATLIKLAKNEVENRQKSLAETLARQDIFISQKNDLLDNLESEKKSIARAPEMAATFGKFAKATLDKVARINKEIARLEKIIEEKREHLREAFVEQKRYEIALEIKLAEEAQKQNRREQIKMDELAITGFRRKKI